MDWFFWTVTAALALAGGIGGACESALLSLSRSRLKDHLAQRPRVGRMLRYIVDNIALVRLNAALLHAACIAGLVLFVAGDSIFARTGPAAAGAAAADGAGGAWVIVAEVAALILAVVAWRAAAALAGGFNPEGTVLRLAPLLGWLTLPCWPFSRFFLLVRDFLARGAGHPVGDDGENAEQKVIAAVSDGALDGVVHEAQRDMIEGVFDLKDADVADVFTPRTEMVAIDVELPLAQAIRVGLESGYSRLPVYRETRDNILGVFVLRDALPYFERPADERPAVETLMRPPVFVPETKKIADLLRDMQRDHNHIAVVLDEYGGTAGLVTIEDVLEEIVGDIQDEFDSDEGDAPAIHRTGENAWSADGSLHVGDVNEALGGDWLPEDGDYETLGGFVLANLGHIPKAGESFDWRPPKMEDAVLRVQVLDADARKVERVSLRRESPGPDEAAG